MNKSILLTTDGELQSHIARNADGLIVSGLVIGESDFQNINVVCIANKGEFKNNPVLGVGAEKYLKSIGRANDLRREISVQLNLLGYNRADVKVNDNGIINIDV